MDRRLYKQLREIERNHWWFRGRRAIFLAALDRLAVRGSTILDCGCGAGSNLDVLRARYPDAAIYGIDIEREPLEFLREERSLPVNQADAARLPFLPASFDLVAALDAIEHVEDDERALAELYRVCKPGGTLLLSVPAFPFLWGNIDEVGHHYRRYRRAPLVAQVERVGFEIRFVRFFNYLLFAPIAAVRLAMRLRPTRHDRDDDESAEELRSDFDLVKSGPLNSLLARLFSLEAGLLGLAPPFGVSLLLVARRPAEQDL